MIIEVSNRWILSPANMECSIYPMVKELMTNFEYPIAR